MKYERFNRVHSFSLFEPEWTASTQKKEKKALKSIQLSINLAVLKHSHDSLGTAI